MVPHSSLMNNPQMQQILKYTQMLLAHMAVVDTFKASAFNTTGSHTKSSQNACRSHGKNSLLSLLQPSHGITPGVKSVSHYYCDNLTIINSREGKLSKHLGIMSLLCIHYLLLVPSCTTGTVTANTNPCDSKRASNAHLQDLMSLAPASSMQATYSSGVK